MDGCSGDVTFWGGKEMNGFGLREKKKVMKFNFCDRWMGGWVGEWMSG